MKPLRPGSIIPYTGNPPALIPIPQIKAFEIVTVTRYVAQDGTPFLSLPNWQQSLVVKKCLQLYNNLVNIGTEYP